MRLHPGQLDSLLQTAFTAHRELAERTAAACAQPLVALVEICARSLEAGGKILFFGNGGSAADAQHLATELTVRYLRDRSALAALALTTDTSTLTAAANDLGFEQIFARQVEALGRAGDVAIGITTSGNSKNVLLALEAASAKGLIPTAFTGQGGGSVAKIAQPLLAVPSNETPRIQEMHILLGHLLCDALEKTFVD